MITLISCYAKKLAKRIGPSRSIRHYLSVSERKQFFNAIIKPVFMYGGLIWSLTSQDNLRGIFRLQKRAARVILNAKIREKTTVTLFEKLNWMPFYDDFKINKGSVIYKCVNELSLDYLSCKFRRISRLSSRTSRYGNITLVSPKCNRNERRENFYNISN